MIYTNTLPKFSFVFIDCRKKLKATYRIYRLGYIVHALSMDSKNSLEKITDIIPNLLCCGAVPIWGDTINTMKEMNR